MRIAIDIQGIQSEGSRTRGIGRYSLEVIKNIIRKFPEYEIILFANAALLDLRMEFTDYLKNKNVTYFQWYSPTPFDYISMDKNKTKLAICLRSYALRCLHVDIILITSFFEGFSDNCCVDFDYEFINIPIVSIFYDLIPLINPNLYFTNNPDFEKYYKSKIKKIKKLDGLLAISSSSSEEAIKYLSFNPSIVFNISSACDKDIFNSSSEISSSITIDIDKYSPFILYSGASDPRKNVKSLLEAYSELPLELRNYKLVLVGKLLTQEVELLNEWINLFNIDSKMIIQTGYVSDMNLVALYRKCSLFVFPSLHEGFGLPVLEAMSCGAPVIGSNSTSIPEVLGLKAAMFDPTNICSIKELMIKSLINKDFNDLLRRNSIKQTEKFSWAKTAEETILACKTLIKDKLKQPYELDWTSISQENKHQLNFLINNIKRKKLLKNNKHDNLSSQVASSIDQITIQLDSLAREISCQEGISSWRVEGPFDSSYSLSILNRSFVEALNSKLNKVSIHITEGLGDYEPNIKYLSQYSKIFSIFQFSKKLTSQPNVISRNLYPPRVEDMNSKLNILHSYGWEESEFPFEWVNNFNSYLQGITVMSNQVKKILIDNGVRVPIRVSGLGIDHLTKVQPSSDFEINAKGFKFLHISSCFPRKGIDILLKAFAFTFTIKDNVSLIIKTFDNPHNNVDLILDDLKKSYPLFPDVILIKDDMNERDLKSLYLQSDVLVAPSRGEGFGLPIAEAMFLGMPVITTNWGGQKDFCNNQNSWLIDYKFVPSKSHFNLYKSYWAEPLIHHLSQLLSQIYNASKQEIEQKTILAKSLVEELTWDKVAVKNLSFAKNDFCKYKKRISQIGWVSTWSSKCGIASYSRRLINSMSDQIVVFSPFDEPKVTNSEGNIIPCWDYPFIAGQDLDQLYLKISTANITSLVIQFNYGFFEFDKLSDLINKLIESNINVIVFMHSTTDPKDQPQISLNTLYECLSKCQRILVHTIDDLNRLKAVGLVDNVAIFPHGILDFSPDTSIHEKLIRKNNTSKRFTIASYGFCLPDKGFVELIKAIKILQNKNIEIHLNIFAATYNENYKSLHDELIELIHHLDIHELVTLSNKYIPEEEISKILSEFDLIVFPYQTSNESSSASVRDGLSSLKPVVVTPISIFNDISELVDFFPGTSPSDLANGLSCWHQKYLENSGNLNNIQPERKRLIEELRFSNLSQRLFSLIISLELN